VSCCYSRLQWTGTLPSCWSLNIVASTLKVCIVAKFRKKRHRDWMPKASVLRQLCRRLPYSKEYNWKSGLMRGFSEEVLWDTFSRFSHKFLIHLADSQIVYRLYGAHRPLSSSDRLCSKVIQANTTFQPSHTSWLHFRSRIYSQALWHFPLPFSTPNSSYP